MAKKSKKTEEKLIKLSDMTGEELKIKAKQLSTQIAAKKMEMAVGRVKNTREAYELRKQLARVKTVLSQKSAVKSPNTAK